MKTIIPSISILIAMIGSCLGEEPAVKAPETSPEMAAVAANDRAYEAAYAKGDVKALADFYTDDVVYTDEDGNVREGKPAIEAALGSALASDKGAKLMIGLDSVRVLAPEVVVENGSTTVVSKEGESSSSLFTAIHVKKDGKWKIRQLVESPAPLTNPGGHLSELSWLIGDWNEADKEAGVTVLSHYQWARGGNFITRNVTVKREDAPVLEGWQIIGWNPVENRIRSWTFDDAGGFTEGVWSKDGESWLSREAGYAPDGSRTSADHILTKAGPDRLFWEATNRTLDGDPQPGIGRIEINRVKGE
ncbi:MAG: SgcJ/EcaC family oxidoreductase [Verrucomicrobiota bacterium]